MKFINLFLIIGGLFSLAAAPQKLRYKNILLRDFRTVKNNQVINFNIGTAACAIGCTEGVVPLKNPFSSNNNSPCHKE